MTIKDDILADATVISTQSDSVDSLAVSIQADIDAAQAAMATITTAVATVNASLTSAETKLATLNTDNDAIKTSVTDIITLMGDCDCDGTSGGGGSTPSWLPLVGGNAPLYYADFVNSHFWAAGAEQSSLASFLTAAGFTGNASPRIHPTRGMYLEGARTNKCFPSNDFTSANWTKSNVTLTANSITATTDIGEISMTKIADNATNGFHEAYRQSDRTSGAVVCNSIYVKAGTATKGRIWDINSATGFYADFDLTAGTISAATNFGSSTPVQSFIESVGGGVYRVGVSGINSTITNGRLDIGLRNAAGAVSYAGAGDYFYIAYAQSEGSRYPTSYVPTTTAAVTRANDFFIRHFSTSPDAFTRLFKARTAYGAPASGEYQTLQHLDNSLIPTSTYADFELWRYSDKTLGDRITYPPTPTYTQKIYTAYNDNTDFKLCSSGDSVNGLVTSLNGAAAVTVASGGWPTNFNIDRWGTQQQTIRFWDSTVEIIALWETAATATEVQTLSA